MTSFSNEFWRRNGRGLGAVLILAGFAAFYFFPRPPIPFSTVEGTYSNPCCDPVRLADGAFWFGNERVPIKLEEMKFGLVAETDREIVISGQRVTAIAGSNPYGEEVAFDADHRGFNLYEDHVKGYHFTRR